MRSIRLSWLLVISAVLLMKGLGYPESPAFYFYDQGVRLAGEGKLAEAKASFDRTLQADPQNFPTQRCLSILKDIEEQRIEESTGVHLFRAILFFNGYKTDQALQELKKAAEFDPSYALVYLIRADVYQDQKRFDEALASYEKALNLKPRSAMIYLNRANLYVQLSQFDRALEDYDRALEIDPRNILAYYNRGNARAKLGRLQQAVDDYNALLTINPTYPHAYVRKGLAFEQMNRPLDALSSYQAYLKNVNLKIQDPAQVKWIQDKIKTLDKKSPE